MSINPLTLSAVHAIWRKYLTKHEMNIRVTLTTKGTHSYTRIYTSSFWCIAQWTTFYESYRDDLILQRSLYLSNVGRLRIACLPVKISSVISDPFPAIYTLLILVCQTNEVFSCREKQEKESMKKKFYNSFALTKG